MERQDRASAVTTELLARIRQMEWEKKLAEDPEKKGLSDFEKRRYIGGRLAEIAIGFIMLGQSQQVRSLFRQAAEMAHDALAFAPTPDVKTSIRDTIDTEAAALRFAVLADDRSLAKRFAARPMIPAPHPRLFSVTGDRLAFSLALPHLILGNDQQAQTHAKEANTSGSRAWYPHLGDAVLAITANDPSGLQTSLGSILKQHLAYARATGSAIFNSGTAWLCWPARVLTTIAAWRGMQVSEPPGRRGTVPFIIALFSGPPDSRVRERTPITVDFLGEEPCRA